VIRSVLGEGGTAVVYKAQHTRLNALVAVKVVEVEAAYAADAAARLKREAHVCAIIDDPRVPRVYDVGALPDGTPFIVMEMVAGRTLEAILAKGPLPVETAVAITRDLLRGLETVHQHGVVHRDIKPANVIVQFGNDDSSPARPRMSFDSLRVRLMDFGVSRTATTDAANPAITRHGAIVGTPHYMAPEQVAGDTADARADLYATGTMLYEMLAHRAAFEGDSVAEVVTAVMKRDFPPLRDLCPDIPSALDAVVTRAMAERPEDRFESARAMREALQAALVVPEVEEVTPLVLPRAPEAALPRPAPERSVAAIGLFAVTALGLLTALAMRAWPRDVEPQTTSVQMQNADSPQVPRVQETTPRPLVVEQLSPERASPRSDRRERTPRLGGHGSRARAREPSSHAEPWDEPVALPSNPY
jgi:serine/threonine-protein kinase